MKIIILHFGDDGTIINNLLCLGVAKSSSGFQLSSNG